MTVLPVVLLLLVAGCSGGSGGGADDGTTPTEVADAAVTPAGSGADAGPSDDSRVGDSTDGAPTGDAATGDAATGDDPTGVATGGEDSGLAAPLSSVADVDSYTLTFTLVSETPEGTIELDGQILAGADGSRYTDWTTELSSGQQIVIQQYLPAGEPTVYTRTRFDDDDPFVSSSQRTENTIPNGLDDPYELAGGASDLQWRYEGVVSTADGQRGTYVIDDVEQLASTTPGFDSQLEFREVEYVVYVDPRTEQVTRISYTAVVFDTESGVEQDLRLDSRYTEVGSTTVDRPGWVDGA